jgi:hypothetical protein
LISKLPSIITHTHTRTYIIYIYIYISISIFTYVHITGRARSELLDADAPSEADVEVTDYDRSLIRIGDLWIRWPPRPLRIPTKHKVVVHQWHDMTCLLGQLVLMFIIVVTGLNMS